MRQRCSNPMATGYESYGGRGIKVCARWQSFAHFYSDMGERPEGCSLDRIDRDGDYEPANCRWATAKTQNRNQRSNIRVAHNGVALTLMEWSERLGIGYGVLWDRLDSGWPVAKVLTAPVHTEKSHARGAA